MASMSYWNYADDVKRELKSIAGDAEDAYAALESNDDPGELADLLVGIKKRIDNVSAQLIFALPPLRKASAAMEKMPTFKGL